MTRFRFLLILSCLSSSISLKAQNLAAFQDYRNYFFVFDAGTTTNTEYLPVQSFKVGGREVAYIDNTGSLKAWYQGKAMTLSDGIISKYEASDYLVSFSIYQMLSVFDSGKTIRLSEFAEQYSTGDSLVAFYDNRNRKYNIYYRGAITTLEDGMTQAPLQSFKMGDNVFAYINYLNEFRIFYRGAAIKLMTLNSPVPYEAGRNIVGYKNAAYGFSVFYKGDTYDLEPMQPAAFVAGDDMMAYLTNNGELKVFYEGKTESLCLFEPSFYQLKDSMLVYDEGGKFKVYYRGNRYTLENYIPKSYLVDLNTIAYLDQQGRLKTFSGGKASFVTNSGVDEFELYHNVIHYRINNDHYMYCNGKTYRQ